MGDYKIKVLYIIGSVSRQYFSYPCLDACLDASMRRILIAARLGKTNKDLYNTVATILDAFYFPTELAEYYRTGKGCPTKPGTMPKKKFPKDILNAISGKMGVIVIVIS